MVAEIRVPSVCPVEIVGNIPRDFFLLVTINFPVGLLEGGEMKNSELTCKTCRLSVLQLVFFHFSIRKLDLCKEVGDIKGCMCGDWLRDEWERQVI